MLAVAAAEPHRMSGAVVSMAKPDVCAPIDANGNLTSDGAKTYSWNALNQLVEVKEGTTTIATFEYDGAGRRTEKVAAGLTHQYVYDAEDIVEERITGSSSDTIRYHHGVGIDEPLARTNSSSVTTYYLADHLGSVVQETNASGAVALEREYGPWGDLLSGASMAGYAFTGREWDAEIGLYYYRARYYSPGNSRFISNDPLGLQAGPNSYAYVEGNPVSRIDPTGEDWWSATKSFGEAALLAAGGTVVVSATLAASPIVGGALAVGGVLTGAYQGTIALQKIVTGRDPYTGQQISGEARIDSAAGLVGGLVGGGLALRGGEITLPGGSRIAPFGNRTGNTKGGELPHYHRRVPDPNSPGNSLSGQGIGRHRPWETKSTDKGFSCRF